MLNVKMIVAGALSIGVSLFGLMPSNTDFGDFGIKPEVVQDVVSSDLNQSELLGPFEVVRVVDGDTLIIDYYSEKTRVRLIGVDTPESVHADESRNTVEGAIASDYTKSLLQQGSLVYLELDVQELDVYERLLAYVYLEDGTFLNAHLLETGMATVATYKPNVKYQSYFESIAK